METSGKLLSKDRYWVLGQQAGTETGQASTAGAGCQQMELGGGAEQADEAGVQEYRLL
jgi:hypothetical protein